MTKNLIESLELLRDYMKDKKLHEINVEITRSELNVILTGLKMYDSFESVLDEEIGLSRR